jgi:hypothetical protein
MERISQLIETTDYIRQAFLDPGQSAWSKEWHHFCILTDEIEVILNMNLSGDTRPAALPGARLARMILLVREGRWQGDVDSIPTRDVSVRLGKIDLQFGHNRVRFRDGGFEISAALQSQPVSLHLRLVPTALPLLLFNNTPIGPGQINWLVVPRLEASGKVIVGGRVYELDRARAYHDHNWGKWLWGHDFAWEWGFILPEQGGSPWGLVFDRTTNRSRTDTLELTLALWKGSQLKRIFSQRDISINRSGFLQQKQVLKVPRVMRLLSPELTTDTPAEMEIQAVKGEDRLAVSLKMQEVCQIAIPNETDLGVTLINEISGRARVEGEVKGERIEFSGRGIFEILT